jgi:hypothetical protein
MSISLTLEPASHHALAQLGTMHLLYLLHLVPCTVSEHFTCTLSLHIIILLQIRRLGPEM